MFRCLAGFVLCFLLALMGASTVAAADCQFVLGFNTLRDLIGHEIVGECLENEHYNEISDSVQQTTGGLMAWRKADNWTAFTDGYRTWVNGPNGLQQRLNTERFEWEADYAPGGGVATPTPVPTPTPFAPGTYRVGVDIQAGIYRGNAGFGILESCYWERLKGVSGDFSDILANDNAIGQFYVELLSTDSYFSVRCEMLPIEAWPQPDALSSTIEAGTYLVGRDIAPGTYRGKAGSGILESCYWERLRDLTGASGSIISNDNAIGTFFVAVEVTDRALTTRCALELVN